MARPVDLTIRVKADTGDVAPGMAKLDKQLDTATKSAAKLDGELADISKHDVDLDVNTEAITNARRKINDLRDDIAKAKSLDIDADTRDAEKQIANLKRSIKALGDDTGSSRPLSTVAIDADQSFGHASERVGEFKDEARQNFGEITSSFAGSMDSISDLVQGTLGGLAGSLAGPVGIALGAASVGVGVLVAGLQKSAEAANKVTDEAVALNDSLSDTTTAAERVEVLQQRWNDLGNEINDVRSIWELWQDRSTTNMEAFAKSAKVAGLDVKALNDAFVDPDPQRRLKELNAVLSQQKGVLADAKDALDNWTVSDEDAWNATQKRADAIEDSNKLIEEEIRVSTAAAEIEQAKADSMGQSIEAYRKAQKAIEDKAAADADATAEIEAQQAAYQSLADNLAAPASVYQGLLDDMTQAEQARAQSVADGTKSSADSWEDYATTVAVTTEDMIAEWNRQADQSKKFEENLAKIGAAGGQALADSMREQGPEVAGAAAEMIANSDPTTLQAAIDAQQGAATAGAKAGQAYADAIRAKEDEVNRAWKKLVTGIGAPASVPTSVYPRVPSPVPGGQSVMPGAAAAPNIRVYIDGNALRATVRQDVSAATAQAALVSTSRSRP